VRGARNYPCMGVPGKRAPTVATVLQRQALPAAGDAAARPRPRPIDPNLIAQGITGPNDRVDFNDRIFAPTEGTHCRPGAAIPQGPPDGAPPPPPGPAPVPVGPPTGRLRLG